MPKKAFKPQQILWVDLEMTGLNPTKDVILEVAAIATDWDFNVLDKLEGVVRHPLDELEELLNGNKTFWDDNLVAREALIKQNESGLDLREVEARLLGFIDKNFDKDSLVLLAGNSIHMDRQFIDAYWPNFSARLHYRMLDVSAWKVVFEGKFKKAFAKPENHRALDDIEGSIMELKYYLSKAYNVKP